MNNDLIKKLETCIKWCDSDVTCSVKIIDLQRLIQEYKNQEYIIQKMAEDLRTPINSPEWIIKYYKERLTNGK